MARVDVIMPQMGESIAEGTVTKWLKKIGESVKRDEPLFEISTDKVDAEIPSPVAGVLGLEHRAQLGGHAAGHEGHIGGVRHGRTPLDPEGVPSAGTRA